ncbi:unnamed protein product [Boreogadus saida]
MYATSLVLRDLVRVRSVGGARPLDGHHRGSWSLLLRSGTRRPNPESCVCTLAASCSSVGASVAARGGVGPCRALRFLWRSLIASSLFVPRRNRTIYGGQRTDEPTRGLPHVAGCWWCVSVTQPASTDWDVTELTYCSPRALAPCCYGAGLMVALRSRGLWSEGPVMLDGFLCTYAFWGQDVMSNTEQLSYCYRVA